MAQIIDSLIITLGLDASGFTSGQKTASEDLRKTKEQSNQAAKEISASGKTAAEFFGRLRNEALTLFAVFAGGQSLKNFAENITKGDAATSRLAHNLGMSTELLSAWETAAERTGGSAQATGASFDNLTQQIQEFSLTGKGGPAIPYFRSMGIALTDAQGKARPMNDILLDLADKLSKMDARQAINFGRAIGLDDGTINMLMKGRAAVTSLLDESRKLGVANDEDGARAQQLLHSWADLEQAATSLGRTIVNDLSPSIQKALDWMDAWIQKNREWLASEITAKVQAFVHYLTNEIDWNAILANFQRFGNYLVNGINWQVILENIEKFADYLINRVPWQDIINNVARLTDNILSVMRAINKVVEATTGWTNLAEGLLLAWSASKFVPLLGVFSSLIGLTRGVSSGMSGLIALAASPAFLAAIAVLGSTYAAFKGAVKSGTDIAKAGESGLTPAMLDENGNAIGYKDKDGKYYSNEDVNPDKASDLTPDPFKKWISEHAPTILGGSEVNNFADPDKLMEYFKNQGWTTEQASGILGNFKAESNFNAGAVGDNGKAAGLGQWRDSRRDKFKEMYGHDLPQATAMEQAEFTNWELTHTEKAAGDALRNAKSAKEAGEIISRQYERPLDKEGNARLRGGYAEKLSMVTPRNPVADLSTGASASPAARQVAQNTNNTSTNEVSITGPITVNTRATDAKGIAAGIGSALRDNMMVSQANAGLN